MSPIGALLGGARNPPLPAIPPAAEPPGRSSAEVAEAARLEQRRALLARGRTSTNLGGSFGPGGVVRKTLLGE